LAGDYGLELRAYDFYAMIYPFPLDEIEDLAYYFADRKYDNSYISVAAKWLNPLREIVGRWQDLWRQRGRRLEPALRFGWRRGRRIVFDTRSGSDIEYELDPVGLGILRLLFNPKKCSHVLESMSGADESMLMDRLVSLKTHGLAFE
jgi:hypothetical protein